jgi:hypothetical protein
MTGAAPELLAAAVALPEDRLRSRAGHLCAAQYDEDATTLAAEAVLAVTEQAGPAPAALILASVTPPYDEGGFAQTVAEIAGLGDRIFAAELTATPRDGLAAVRLGCALAAAGEGPVLVCAAHRRRPSGEREEGDGAVALLIGQGQGQGLARMTPGAARAEELRDRWRLPGDLVPRAGDASFVEELGPSRLARELAADAAPAHDAAAQAHDAALAPRGEAADSPQIMIAGPARRAADRVERSLGGAGDSAASRTGVLGAAHPLLRLLLGLERSSLVVAASGGLGETLRVSPSPEAGALARAVAAQVAGGHGVERVASIPQAEGFDPYASTPRAWRERGQDLRLEGVLHDGRIHYPPPAGLDGPRQALPRRGRVLTATLDHVYPGADSVQMAVLSLTDGSRFYCQVAAGACVAIGDEVRLVPRRLHAGGGAVQYFWKALPCR